MELGDIVIPAACPVLGLPLVSGRGSSASCGPRPEIPTLDRINPARGYTKDNVRVISWRANKIKGDATPGELAAVLRYVKDGLGIS